MKKLSKSKLYIYHNSLDIETDLYKNVIVEKETPFNFIPNLTNV